MHADELELFIGTRFAAISVLYYRRELSSLLLHATNADNVKSLIMLDNVLFVSFDKIMKDALVRMATSDEICIIHNATPHFTSNTSDSLDYLCIETKDNKYLLWALKVTYIEGVDYINIIGDVLDEIKRLETVQLHYIYPLYDSDKCHIS